MAPLLDFAKEKSELIEAFQSGRKQLALVSTTAAGEGIRLDKASKAIFVEPEWSPSTVLQAESRLISVRMKSHVQIYHFIANDTLDEMFYDQLESKMENISLALDGSINKATMKYLNNKFGDFKKWLKS